MLLINQPKTAIMFLKKAEQLMLERGKQYNSKSKKERSFAAVATAFTAITNKPITAAEVCLMLQILKNVRQWGEDRFHSDSAEDNVAYAALLAEELFKQYEEQDENN